VTHDAEPAWLAAQLIMAELSNLSASRIDQNRA
jgi:RNA polymerase sigma-70 factor (ECF subfamily)